MGNKKKAPKALAWKFLNADHKLRYSDGRELVAGKTLRDPVCCGKASCDHGKGPLLCFYGFHASENPIDALRYATGMTHIARVEIGGEIVRGDDKLAGTTIRCLWIADAEKTLRLFAIACCWRQMGYRLRGCEPSLAALWALDCAERFVLGETDEEERSADAAAAAAAAYAYAAAAYAERIIAKDELESALLALEPSNG